MTRGNWLMSTALVTLLLTLVVRANSFSASANATADKQDLRTSRPQDLTVSDAAPSEYLGSAACERCHQAEHGAWKNSLHIKMTRPIAEATVVGDFREGTKFSDHDRSYQFGMKDGKPYISISFGGAAPETFAVEYTLGSKRYQGYLAKLPAGGIYVLPVFWHVANQRWIDWKEITPIPEGAHGIRQIWNTNCFNCHATNIVQGYDVNEKAYKSTWTEMGIGCEACHGPGKPHVALMDAWEKDPASKPKYDNSASNRQLSDLLKTVSFKSAEPRRIYDTCAYCHGNKRNVFVGFKAGGRYEDYAVPFLVSSPIPDNDLQGEFWPDGRPNRFNRNQALTLSGCFKAGAITCTSCHLAHGSANEFSLKENVNSLSGDVLCTQCHTTPKTSSLKPSTFAKATADKQAPSPSFTGPGLEAHTFHAPESDGSRCVNCHMSDVNWRLLNRRRDHTLQPPVPENTARFGIPNACTTCHDDKSPEWAAKQMSEWWHDDERRAKTVAVADVMYRAGSGDGSTLPELAKLAVDRSQGLIIRASAADYIGRLVAESRGQQRNSTAQSQTSFVGLSNSKGPRRVVVAEVTPAIVNALIGAANDPEPIVRVAAVDALGMVGDRQRSMAPILARLVDQTRVVRSTAAEVLVSFGIIELPGAAGEALKKAQDEYIVSLDSFPDAASRHAAKAWLESERGNIVVARDAVNKATIIEPNYAFAWVVKGVLSAREGKFAEALEMWKKARSIEPSYPNIDQLIAEAEKRK
jgi:predicted CXXCH cytochrome family protein